MAESGGAARQGAGFGAQGWARRAVQGLSAAQRGSRRASLGLRAKYLLLLRYDASREAAALPAADVPRSCRLSRDTAAEAGVPQPLSGSGGLLPPGCAVGGMGWPLSCMPHGEADAGAAAAAVAKAVAGGDAGALLPSDEPELLLWLLRWLRTLPALCASGTGISAGCQNMEGGGDLGRLERFLRAPPAAGAALLPLLLTVLPLMVLMPLTLLMRLSSLLCRLPSTLGGTPASEPWSDARRCVGGPLLEPASSATRELCMEAVAESWDRPEGWELLGWLLTRCSCGGSVGSGLTGARGPLPATDGRMPCPSGCGSELGRTSRCTGALAATGGRLAAVQAPCKAAASPSPSPTVGTLLFSACTCSGCAPAH